MPRALQLLKRDRDVEASVRDVPSDRLPDGDVLLSIQYSSLNYKDGLAVTGRGKVIRGEYPFVPGIDLVGRVEESSSGRFGTGDLVIGTGWGLGESHWGGFAEKQRVDSSWLVALPAALTAKQAMVAGTAGLTAALSLLALESHGAVADAGDYLVTGASGGVGSFAVALLSAAGFRVVAATGSQDAHEYLEALGAARIIHRDELAKGPDRPLDSARWAGAVDVVGGQTLAAVLRRLQRHASVAACGLAGGAELDTTVYPFILRGVSLLGIDSNTCPNDLRQRAWERLAALLPSETLDRIHAGTIGLDDVPAYAERILAGEIRGRVVVDVNRKNT